MYRSLKKLYLEFSPKEKQKLLFLSLLIVVTALLQVVGIASIFPFISVASNPSVVSENVYLLALKVFFNIESEQDFIVFLGLLVLAALILTNMFLVFSTWVTVGFVEKLTHDLSCRLLQRYLYESYLFHLQRNSAELLKNLSTEVYRVVNGGILSAINVVSKGLTVLCILIFLVLVDPLIAFIVGGVLSASYAFIYWAIRAKLGKVGEKVTLLFTEKMRFINESLIGIKELKVLGRESDYLEKFNSTSQEIVKNAVFNRYVIELPKYVLETVAFGGILAMTIYLISIKNEMQSVLPMISLYALAGYRLMPALQSIFQSTATLKHDIAAVDLFYDDIKSSDLLRTAIAGVSTKITFNNNLRMENIGFSYPKTNKPALRKASFVIKANTSIGVIGSSGSGKSTLIDVLLGLLPPETGEFIVDGKRITPSNLRAWQDNIGYVPQVIFLADSTLSENIAFGIPLDKIDNKAVEAAAKMANLHDFIINDLDDGYQAKVGEQGIRLSGGQRQRVGIARALYHNPAILVLDEATSALDTPTETAVMEAVHKLSHEKTIIMIAHRLSTVMRCDNILWLEDGEIKAFGRYNELVLSDPAFKEFVNSGQNIKR